MSKARSRRPASDTRSHRRSLAEVTEAVGRAVDDGLRATPADSVVASADDPPRSERATERPRRTEVPEQVAAPISAARADAANTQASRGSEGAAPGSAAEMIVQIARNYQNSVLDNFRAGLNAALDHARDFAEMKRAGESAGDAAPENDALAAFGAATEVFRADAFELMQANVATALDYARELAGARTAAEVVALTGTQARKSCELMLKQADALKTLAQVVVKDRGRE